MAIDLQEVFNIRADEGRQSLAQLRNEINELRNALFALQEGSEEYNQVALEVHKRQQKIAEVMQDTKRPFESAKGSFNALNDELRVLKEMWKATGDEMQRGRLTEQINEVKAKMNAMNESIGNYQHNVGNYTNSIIDAFKQMGISFGGTATKMFGMFGMLTGGLGKLGAAFKSLWATLLANPIGIVIGAVGLLAGAFSALSRAIHENEESEERLHRAMAAFRPISDKFKGWLDQVAQGFVNFAEAVADAWNWLRKAYGAYTDWMGITQGRKEKIEQEIKFYGALADAENKIDNIRRKNRVDNSKDQARIDELRQEAAETENLAAKKKMLAEAYDLQTKINNRNIDVAERELKIIQAQAKLAPNSAEMNDKVAEAEAKVNDARSQGDRALRSITRELNRYTKAAGSATKQVDEHAQALEREREAMLKAHEAARQRAEGILKESQEALLSERDAEKKNYEERREELEAFNLSTEALDEAHRRKVRELDQRDAEAKAEADKAALAHEEEMRRMRAEAEESASNGYSVWDYDTIAAQYDAELEAFKANAQAKMDINTTLMEQYDENSKEYQALERENERIAAEVTQAEVDNTNKKQAAWKKMMDARVGVMQDMSKKTSTILNAVSKAFGENTKAGKAFAIASATIDTIASAVAGFRAGYNQWKDAPGPLAAMAPIQGAINAAAALAAGYAQVQSLKSVDTSGNGGGGGATATAMAIPNIEGLSSPVDYTRQVTTETEKEEMNRDNRVYILESDIQQSNNRVRVREEETTF